jgi:hypothetical protein
MAGRFGKYIGAGLTAFFAAALAPAYAQDCPPLTKFTGVKLETLPNSKRVLVPVTINNVPKKFLLDTAGISGYITKETSDELKLTQMSGMRNFVKSIKTFGLGSRTYEVPNTSANDTTLIAAEYPVSSDRDGDIDGTLTNGWLLKMGELDIDFPGGTLNLFSPQHCPGKVNYWGAPDIGSLPLSYEVLDIGENNSSFSGKIRFARTMKIDLGHLTVPVTLDGHAFNAWIDTSAEKSSISLEVVERIFNLPREQLGPLSQVKVTPEAALGFHNPHIIGNNRFVASPDRPGVARAEVYRHKFSGLSLGHVDIKNLELLIVPDLWGRNNDIARRFYYTPDLKYYVDWTADIAGQGGNRGPYSLYTNAKRDVPDMVLGMDVLRHLHIFISPKEQRMYFSVGAAPAPATASAPAATAN